MKLATLFLITRIPTDLTKESCSLGRTLVIKPVFIVRMVLGEMMIGFSGSWEKAVNGLELTIPVTSAMKMDRTSCDKSFL